MNEQHIKCLKETKEIKDNLSRDLLKALNENIENISKDSKGSEAIVVACIPILTNAMISINSQLTRIADSLKKVACQDCCKTAGDKIKENENEKE